MNYKVGQLVVNRKLGLGKVLEVRGNSVTVFFKDQTDNPRTINVAAVPMALAKEQSDPLLDNAKLSRKKGPGPRKRAAKPPAGKTKGE
jgi:hypothetical protein